MAQDRHEFKRAGERGSALSTPERPVRQSAGTLDLEQLYRDNFQKVYNYAYYRLLDPALAEDITSITFVKVAEKIHLFDPAKASFSTWAIRIAHNSIIDYYRKRKVDSPIEGLGSNEPSCEDEYPELDERAKEVARLLSFISEEDRELVFLKYYEGKRNVEIARMLEMNPATVSTRLSRAIAKMRKHVVGQP